MTEVRNKGSYEQWVKFFLQAVYESAEDATDAIDKLTVLHDKNAAIAEGMGRGSKTAMRVFAYLEENPIIEIRKAAAALGVTFNAASDAVRRLTEAGVLVQATGVNRNRTFAYDAYLEILRNGT